MASMRPLILLRVAGAFDDRAGFLVDHDALGAAELVERELLERDAEVLEDRRAAGEDGDVLEHGLAAVAEAGGLDGAALEDAAELVEHEGGEGFALDLLGDDEQGLARPWRSARGSAEKSLMRAELLLVNEDVGVVEGDFHRLGLVDEVRRDVALVELHAFDEVDGRLDALAFLDRDDAVLADLVHGLGDLLADLAVLVGGGGADLGDLLLALDRDGHLLERRR